MLTQLLNPNAPNWSYRDADRLEEAKAIAIDQLERGHNSHYVQNTFTYNLIRYGVYATDSMWLYLIMSTPSKSFTKKFVNGFKHEDENSTQVLDEICDVLHH